MFALMIYLIISQPLRAFRAIMAFPPDFNNRSVTIGKRPELVEILIFQIDTMLLDRCFSFGSGLALSRSVPVNWVWIGLLLLVVTLETRQWYVVYSKPHKEEFVEYCLQLKGLEVFLPRLLFPESFRKRKRIVPLFPNYLFTRIRIPEDYYYVLWSHGVKHFVSFNGVPAPLDEKIVSLLMQQASPEGIITARSDLKTGQEVEITGGPFRGLMGVIQEPPNAKWRVKILMKLLSRHVNVEVPIQFVKSGWVAHSPEMANADLRQLGN
jgi:transcription antitermination factor NusG